MTSYMCPTTQCTITCTQTALKMRLTSVDAPLPLLLLPLPQSHCPHVQRSWWWECHPACVHMYSGLVRAQWTVVGSHRGNIMSHMHTYVTYMYARAMCVQVRDQGMYVFYSVPFSVHTIYGHVYNIVCATLPVVCVVWMCTYLFLSC